MRTPTEIQKDIETESARIARHNAVVNEGGEGYADYTKIEKLSDELRKAEAALSPLSTPEGVQKEREWFNSQRFTDSRTANYACRARGYELYELQAAAKAAK